MNDDGRNNGNKLARPPPYLLAVLQDALLGADTALGAGGVQFPLAALHVDVNVELPAEHGNLGLGQQAYGHVGGHLGGRGERGRDALVRERAERGERERERERTYSAFPLQGPGSQLSSGTFSISTGTFWGTGLGVSSISRSKLDISS